MSGGSGPSEITPLPADGGVVKSSLWFRPPASEITPLPADGGVVRVGGKPRGLHIGSLRFGSTGPGW